MDDLQRGLGSGDRRKIAQYLDAVRDVERRIQRAEEQSGRDLPLAQQPAGVPVAFDEYMRLMFELQRPAWQTIRSPLTAALPARTWGILSLQPGPFITCAIYRS